MARDGHPAAHQFQKCQAEVAVSFSTPRTGAAPPLVGPGSTHEVDLLRPLRAPEPQRRRQIVSAPAFHLAPGPQVATFRPPALPRARIALLVFGPQDGPGLGIVFPHEATPVEIPRVAGI